MPKNPLYIIAAIAVIIILAYGAYRVYRSNNRSSVTPMTTVPASSPEVTTSAPTQTANTITISSNSFSPQTTTIKAGDSATWTNNDSQPHQVNSDVHPTHLLYPPLNEIGLIQPGQSKSLTFPTPGTYKYHDHLNPSLTGTVIVQ
ncbi:cupredoxin domain-containing protein [Candidatus Daviesbacteria bacterium]|nr:cupredoxin domain-containing protein [Candidatus Daviesbacteria bacterium]